jgi:diaminopimelate decarboxylase
VTTTAPNLRDATDTSVDPFPDLAAHREVLVPILAQNPPPIFLGERAILADRFAELEQQLKAAWPSSTIAYSFKTNYGVARSGIVRELGGWAEVVSGREYAMARELGYPGDQIIFNGPFKRDAELERAMADGAVINVNDEEELRRLDALAAFAGRQQRIGLRVRSHGLRLRRPSRFGFSLDDDEATRALAQVRESRHLELAGLHFHLAGDTDDVEIYRSAAELLADFVRAQVPEPLGYVDMGGGFPAHNPKPRSRTDWNPRPIGEYVQAITGALDPAFPRASRPRLILEPGRYLVCDAIVLVTEVIRAQVQADRQRVVCNGTISMQPLAHYCPQVLRAYGPDLEPRSEVALSTLVNGASCREDDELYEGPLAPVQVGDLLVHYAAGAYNANLSPDFIFETPGLVFF